MRRWFVAPLLWGLFLSASVFAAGKISTLKPSLFGSGNRDLAATTTSVRHYKILAIRVEFQPDSISTTTGNGQFGSGYPATAQVDPLPHDRAYFEDHLTFLKNYFGEVSDDSLKIDAFAVYPLQADSAYRLTNQMWHYNFNAGKEDLEIRLVELFQDSWEAAAADSNIQFSDWDTFVIFHAGTGQDFTVGFDETPHDIPSAYFTLEDLRQTLNDPTYLGVQVGNSYITGGILLPETERQFEVDADIALNGTATLLFGQWIGLPALYNTETGASGVGRFDLMDQGSGNFAGLIPARPCAWSRAFMGWATPRLITPAAIEDTFRVNITGRNNPADTSQHEIYRINLNENEYYLFENRSWDPHALGYTYAYDRADRKMKIKEDYSIEADPGFQVIVKVDNYDFGLPGEGILIWHINDQVIDQNYTTNTVNNDADTRGVSLIEADAAPDIGKSYVFLDVAYGTEFGWAGDFFFAGNQQFLNANPQLSRSVIFYDDSHPSTRTQDGSATGIKMGGFSAADTVMNFWIKSDWAQIGFPQTLAEPSANLSLSPIDFDEDGKTDLILTMTPGGAIQALDSLGRAVGTRHETRTDTTLLGEIITIVDTLLARADSITATPAVDVSLEEFTAFFPGREGLFYSLNYSINSGATILDSIQINNLICRTPLIASSGTNRRWYACLKEGVIAFQGGLDTLGRATPFGSIGQTVGICLADTGINAPIFAVSSSKQMALIGSDLLIAWSDSLPFVPAYAPLILNHYIGKEGAIVDVAVMSGQGEVAFLNPDNGQTRPGFPINIGMTITAPPTAADFDQDGRLELILIGENRIVAVQNNAILAANWQLLIDPTRPRTAIVSPPAISELGTPSELKIIFGWPDGSVDARGQMSSITSGFAKSTGSSVTSAPVLVQLDDDPEAELLALDSGGVLNAWHLSQLGHYSDQRHPWNGYLGGNTRQGIASDTITSLPPDQSTLIKTKVYPWPNPATAISHIRYLMGQPGKISVRIFDGSGDLVKELNGSAEAGIEDELDWNLDEVTSGIYIGRVEAESGGKTEHTFIKIAVVK